MTGDWCRHYNGVGNSDTCRVGVRYEDVVDTSQRPARRPCYVPEVRDRCAAYEDYTPEEIEKRNQVVVAGLIRLAQFVSRESENCPQCGQHIDRVEQVGRCVYARPCGCRVFQGRVPDAWKK